MKILLTKYILSAALVAGFLYFFFFDLAHYHLVLDDCFYDGIVRRWGIGGSIELCYKIANGRWFSHIVCAVVFYFLRQDYTLYAGYLTFLMLFFVWAISVLYKNYCKTFLKKEASFLTRISFAFVFTSTLYFLLFEGRWEIWGWVSSDNNHLLSVIYVFFYFRFLFVKNKMSRQSLFFQPL